jgi:hypothetical protein
MRIRVPFAQHSRLRGIDLGERLEDGDGQRLGHLVDGVDTAKVSVRFRSIRRLQ